VSDQASELRDVSLREERHTTPPLRLRCLAVGSGKGGVGKTMISIGLACCLARMKYRVLLMDADIGLANVDLQMGIDPTFTLQDIVYGSCTPEEAVVSVPDGPDVLAAASGAPELADMGSARRQMLVEELMRFASRYDYLVIDVGAGIGAGVTAFLAAAPEVLVVVANEPTSIMDAYSLIKVLRQSADPPSIMLMINMVQSLEEGELLAQRLNVITKKFLLMELPVAGIVMYDPRVGDSIRARRPLIHYAGQSAPAKCLDEMARSIALGPAKSRAGKSVGIEFFDKLTDPGQRSAEVSES
jgi:flagellar biosynthesis protein FlhG